MAVPVVSEKRWREVNGATRRTEAHGSLSWIVTLNATFFCLVSENFIFSSV